MIHSLISEMAMSKSMGKSLPMLNVHKLKVSRTRIQIAEFFEPAVRSIVQAIEEQSRTSKIPIRVQPIRDSLKYVIDALSFRRYSWLEGLVHQTTFFPSWTSISVKGVSPYFDLIPICKCTLAHQIVLNWDQGFSSKAVAEGAISHILDRSVASRMSRYTYGIKCSPTFVPHDPEHVARRHMCRTRPSGNVSVPGFFVAILEKGNHLSFRFEFERPVLIPIGYWDFRGKRIQKYFSLRIHRGGVSQQVNTWNVHQMLSG
jgi:hypothetical protein